MTTNIKLVSKTTMGGVTRYQFDVSKGQGLDDNSSIFQAGLKLEQALSLKKSDTQKTATPDRG